MTYSLFSYALHNTKTIKKETFLNEMNRVIPWDTLIELVEQKRPQKTRGRKNLDANLMLRITFLQLWFGLSDEGIEDDINDRASFQRFLELDSELKTAPDSTTLCKFRKFLHENDLSKQIFESVNLFLEKEGMLIKKGTAVDATLIQAASSTKNKTGKRDPEMSSTKKGANYTFGMKIHAGTDIGTGIVHSLEISTAKEADGDHFETLIHGEEGYVTGDRAYDSKKNNRILRARGIVSGIIKKKPKGKALRKSLQKRNRANASLRCWAEFPFNPVKRIWKQSKARFKGLAKNASWYYLCFTMSNLYFVRKNLLSGGVV